MNFDSHWGSLSDLNDLLSIEEVCREWDNPDWFLKESLENGRALLAYKDGKPAGYLIYQVLWGNSPFCSLIKVVPEYRRMGLATDLINKFEKHLKDEGYDAYVMSTELINSDTKGFFPELDLTEIGILDMVHGKEVFYKKTI